MIRVVAARHSGILEPFRARFFRNQKRPAALAANTLDMILEEALEGLRVGKRGWCKRGVGEMRDSQDDQRIHDWLATCRPDCHLELHLMVVKGRPKSSDLFGRRGKKSVYVLCLVSSEANVESDCELLVLKLLDHGLEEDKKRSCLISDIVSVRTFSQEEPKKGSKNTKYNSIVPNRSTTE